MIPASFKKLVMGMTLEEKEGIPPVSNSVKGGAVELEGYEEKRTKNKSKKVNLSDWVPTI